MILPRAQLAAQALSKSNRHVSLNEHGRCQAIGLQPVKDIADWLELVL